MTKTKLVVRHLPPDMTEETFKSAIEEFKDEFTWSYFHQGKPRQRVEWTRLGVAYLNLKDPNRVHAFAAKMVGRVFQDADGKDYACEVEYAPQQRIPRNRRQKDARQNTILQDEAYLEFCENLNKEPVVLPSAEKQLEAREAEKKEKEDIVIPIIEFVLKSTKMGSRSRPSFSGSSSASTSHRSSDTRKSSSSSASSSSAASSAASSDRGSGKALTRSEDKRRQKERKSTSARSTSSTSSSSSSTSASTLTSPKKEKSVRRGEGARAGGRDGDDKDISRRNRNKRRVDEKPTTPSTPMSNPARKPSS